MRTFTRLFLLSAVVAALAAGDPPAAPPSAGSSSVKLDSLRISREISFPDGRAADAAMTQGLQLSLRGTADPALKVVGQANIVCDSAVSDAGEDLKLPPDPVNADMRRMMRQPAMRLGRGNSTLWAQPLKLKYPVKAAKSVSVSGAFVITCEGKPGEVVEIDLAAPGGKAGADIGGLRFSIDAEQKPGEVAAHLPMALEHRISSVEPIAADGQVLETGGYSTAGDANEVGVRYRLRKQDAKPVKLRITMVGTEVEVRIPFEYKDLPLEAPLAESRPARTAPPQAAPRAEPEPAPKPRTSTDF